MKITVYKSTKSNLSEAIPTEWYLEDGDRENDLDKELEIRRKDLEDCDKELDGRVNIIHKINKTKSKNNNLKESAKLDETKLDEKIPKDLANVYSGAEFDNVMRNKKDLENANYEEITADDAYKLIKSGEYNKLRLIIDDRLVKLRPDGYGEASLLYRVRNLPASKSYTTKSGKVSRDTAHMPVKHLLGIADKIYKTDEDYVKIDQELLDKRENNPESRYSKFNFELVNANKLKDINSDENYYEGPNGRSRWRGERSNYRDNFESWINGRIKDIKQDIDFYERKISEADPSHPGYAERRENWLEWVNSYKRQLQDLYNMKSNVRYAYSANELRKPTREYMKLKSRVNELTSAIDSYEDKINDVKVNGSENTKSIISQIENYEREIMKMKSQIALLSVELESSDESDQQVYNELSDKLTNMKNNLDSASADFKSKFGDKLKAISDNRNK